MTSPGLFPPKRNSSHGIEIDGRNYLNAYLAHFREAYEEPGQWRGGYQGVAHWVPQFGMLALQPLFSAER